MKKAKIKSLIDKNNLEGINYPSEKDDIRKRTQRFPFIFCILKKKNYILTMFSNITQSLKNKLFALIIRNMKRWYYNEVKSYQYY